MRLTNVWNYGTNNLIEIYSDRESIGSEIFKGQKIFPARMNYSIKRKEIVFSGIYLRF